MKTQLPAKKFTTSIKAAHFIWTGGSLNTGQAALPHKNIHSICKYLVGAGETVYTDLGEGL